MSAVQVAASILTADFGNLYRVVRKLERAGVDRLHLDVMDGHFVDNITFGPTVCAAVRRLTTLPIDVHLMIAQPARFTDRFLDAGADTITSTSRSTSPTRSSARRCSALPPPGARPASRSAPTRRCRPSSRSSTTWRS